METETIIAALQSRYPQSTTASGRPVSDADVIARLHALVTPAAGTQSDSLLALLDAVEPEWILSDTAHATIMCLDEGVNDILRVAGLERDIEVELRRLLPLIAAAFLHDPAGALGTPIILLADRIGECAIGWNEHLGRSGLNLLMAIRSAVDGAASNLDHSLAELDDFLAREAGRVKKLEDRLVQSEAGKLRAIRAKCISVDLINKAICGACLTQSMSQFLKGPWHRSIQLLLLNNGERSAEHQRARMLTETIVWSLQPIDPEAEEAPALRQRLYRIVENLPGEIEDLLVALEHGSDATEAMLSAICEEHIRVVSGELLDYAPFTPIPVDSSAGPRTSVSNALMRRVRELHEGQWFTFTAGENSTRIKLVLKQEDTGQLLFTNRNGMKALEKRFDEFAYFMSTGAVKPLDSAAVFSTTLDRVVQAVIRDYARQRRATEEAIARAAAAEAEREAAMARARSEAESTALAEARAEAARQEEIRQHQLEKARLVAERTENSALVADVQVQIARLAIGAWLTLPGDDGKSVEGKLAVRLASADKMIFVNRSGLKVGEYTTSQLVQLTVAGDCSIDDAGVEFEDTLARVVSGLRIDRNKSYDDLTGS